MLIDYLWNQPISTREKQYSPVWYLLIWGYLRQRLHFMLVYRQNNSCRMMGNLENLNLEGKLNYECEFYTQ